jgi:hypothetical protein
MPFEIQSVTLVTVTNANPRRELHGEELVRAIDIAFCLTGENTLLDLIEPGLRAHHYFNKALKDGQETLPDVIVPMPNLRFPKLPQAYHFAKGEKWRGYRLIRDYGLDEDRFDFTDVVLANLHYELQEGGTVKIMGSLQYNGEELEDNETYGMLSGLASEGEIHIRLLAPPELQAAKKGYRAGKPDTPATPASDGSQRELGADGSDDGDEGDGESEGEADGATDGRTAEEIFATESKPAAVH